MASHCIGMRPFSVLKCQDKCTAGELSYYVLSNLPDSISDDFLLMKVKKKGTWSHYMLQGCTKNETNDLVFMLWNLW